MTGQKLLFTPGPVAMHAETLRIGGEQVPYFRNAEFSEVVLESERMLLQLVRAPKGSRALFITASGTAAMEATVINLLSPNGRALVVNGGDFGQRFCDICHIHAIHYHPIEVSPRASLELPPTPADALLINGHETTIGRLYDLDQTGAYCRGHDMLHIVDAISMFVTDELDMERQLIDALILSSHKGLALQPGLCMVVLAPRALKALRHEVRSLYFNFHSYLADGARGQTPFTPAVGIILAMHERLKRIGREGIAVQIARAKDLATRFRAGIEQLPLKIYSEPAPNAMSAVERTDGGDVRDLIHYLEDEHGYTVTPNGGELASRVFRVSHMGEQCHEDIDALLAAINNYFEVNE
jgi:aspartate aminotransferase-like enzyme